MKANDIEYTESSGNIYEDLGFQNAGERLIKAKLARRINELLEGLSQVEAAKILKINQPKVSALANGRLSGFSMEKLMKLLNLLSQDVEIVVKAKPYRRTTPGRLRVAFG